MSKITLYIVSHIGVVCLVLVAGYFISKPTPKMNPVLVTAEPEYVINGETGVGEVVWTSCSLDGVSWPVRMEADGSFTCYLADMPKEGSR